MCFLSVDGTVSDNGDNFSVSNKQVISARFLLSTVSLLLLSVVIILIFPPLPFVLFSLNCPQEVQLYTRNACRSRMWVLGLSLPWQNVESRNVGTGVYMYLYSPKPDASYTTMTMTLHCIITFCNLPCCPTFYSPEPNFWLCPWWRGG